VIYFLDTSPTVVARSLLIDHLRETFDEVLQTACTALHGLIEEDRLARVEASLEGRTTRHGRNEAFHRGLEQAMPLPCGDITPVVDWMMGAQDRWAWMLRFLQDLHEECVYENITLPAPSRSSVAWLKLGTLQPAHVGRLYPPLLPFPVASVPPGASLRILAQRRAYWTLYRQHPNWGKRGRGVLQDDWWK
jgi:hypothetical protein